MLGDPTSPNVPFAGIDNPLGLCRDFTGVARWGNGGVGVGLSGRTQLPYVIDFVRQALARVSWLASPRGTDGKMISPLALELEHGICVGQKRVARLMREAGIIGVSKRRSARKRKNPGPDVAPAPDLVRRRFTASAPNKLWVADITYIETWEGFLFLACVMDMCAKRIVGWSMRDDIEAEIVVDALGMATTRQRRDPDSCITPTEEAVPLTRARPYASRLRDHAVDGLTRRCL